MRRSTRPVVLIAATLLALVTAVPAAAAPATVDVIVVLDEEAPAPGAVAYAMQRTFGATIGAVYEHALQGFAASVPAAALDGLRRHPHVAWIEPDVEVSIAQVTEEVLPTGIDRIDADLNPMDPGLGIGADGSAVEVAVLDTGIKADHPDLHVVAYTDCTDVIAFEIFGQLILSGSCAADGNPWDEDGNGHGTHVAGTIGARAGNGLGVVGAAPDVRLWSIKVLEDNGTGGLGGILAAIDLVAQQASRIAVANMSFGFEGYSAALDTAVRNAVNAGVVFVAAAGNSAIDVAGFAPASTPEAVTVSAVNDWDGAPGGAGTSTACYSSDPDDSLAPFSNFGTGVDIAAPGTCILSTFMDGGYRTYSGTSMAAPHVTGAIARYIAEQEALNGPVPNTGAGVATILSGFFAQYTVPGADPLGFVDDSGDGVHEPMLYLGSGTASPNETPVAAADAYGAVEDTPLDVPAPGVLGNDTDGDEDPLTAVLVTGPANGVVTLNVDGSFTYTPDADWSGTDAFTYRASDGAALSDPATVTVTVSPTNDAPVADDDAYATPHETVLTVPAPGVLDGDTDVDSASLTAVLVSGPSNGTLALDPDGSFTYTPDAGFGGEDAFTYRANDGDLDSDPASVTILVGEAAATPVHLADLSGTASPAPRGRWDATASVTVHDGGHGPFAGATVTGTWETGQGDSCTTAADGTCSMTRPNLKSNVASIGFTVTGISGVDLEYDAGANDVGPTIVIHQDGGGGEPPPDELVTVHVETLEADSTWARNKWDATVTVTIHDGSEGTVTGVTVVGSWDTGATGSCTTNDSGTCSITESGIRGNILSVVFTVTGVATPGFVLDQGSSITVYAPL